jgi:hypothetical protein
VIPHYSTATHTSHNRKSPHQDASLRKRLDISITPKKNPPYADNQKVYKTQKVNGFFFLHPRRPQRENKQQRCEYRGPYIDDDIVRRGRAGRCVYLLEANLLAWLRRVEAILRGYFCDVFWFGESNIDTLQHFCQHIAQIIVAKLS